MVEVQPGERFVQQSATPGCSPRTQDRRPPQLVQRLLFGLLRPIARATGHRGLDPSIIRVTQRTRGRLGRGWHPAHSHAHHLAFWFLRYCGLSYGKQQPCHRNGRTSLP